MKKAGGTQTLESRAFLGEIKLEIRFLSVPINKNRRESDGRGVVFDVLY
jgi:hypothetical protein